MLRTLTDSVLSVIFPNKCAACGCGVERHADGPACASCWDATRVFTGDETLCGRCGAYREDARGEAGLSMFITAKMIRKAGTVRLGPPGDHKIRYDPGEESRLSGAAPCAPRDRISRFR